MFGMTLVEPAPGWSGIGMGADGKFRIDGSALKAGYKCSTQATLRYGWGLTAQVNVAADDKLAWQNTRLITQKWIEAHPTDGVTVQAICLLSVLVLGLVSQPIRFRR